MQKWEHMRARFFADEDELLSKLDMYGREGWELVSLSERDRVPQVGAYYTCTFKRPCGTVVCNNPDPDGLGTCARPKGHTGPHSRSPL